MTVYRWRTLLFLSSFFFAMCLLFWYIQYFSLAGITKYRHRKLFLQINYSTFLNNKNNCKNISVASHRSKRKQNKHITKKKKVTSLSMKNKLNHKLRILKIDILRNNSYTKDFNKLKWNKVRTNYFCYHAIFISWFKTIFNTFSFEISTDLIFPIEKKGRKYFLVNNLAHLPNE